MRASAVGGRELDTERIRELQAGLLENPEAAPVVGLEMHNEEDARAWTPSNSIPHGSQLQTGVLFGDISVIHPCTLVLYSANDAWP